MTPDDLQDTAEAVLAHRLLLADNLAELEWEIAQRERQVIRSILESVAVPR